MSRYDLRWAVRNPGSWLAIWWLHVVVTAILVLIAVAWTAPIFGRVVRPNLWPIGMGAVAALTLAASFAPFERRLQAAVGAALIVMGVVRAVALVDVWFSHDVNGPALAVFALHSLFIAVVGVLWPDWTVACGTRATVEAGREGMGG